MSLPETTSEVKKRPRKNASKQKGCSAEREVSKLFEGVFGGAWNRVHSSGAFTGGANQVRRAGLSTAMLLANRGDVVCADHMPNLVLEVKFYADFPFHRLVAESVPLLDQWIGQTLDSIDDGNVWFLVMKFNRKGWYILHPSSYGLVVGNHVTYRSPKFDDTYIFSSMDGFLETNQVAIEKMSA